MEDGQTKADEYLRNLYGRMDDREQAEFLTSFQKMQDPKYTSKLEACDKSQEIGLDFKKCLDDTKSESHKYLTEFLEREESCKMVKFFYDL